MTTRGIAPLPPALVRKILGGISDPGTLAAIEDASMARHGHDVRWYTWHMWRRLYERFVRATPPFPHDIIDLPSTSPPDYEPPIIVGDRASWPVGDYRAMYTRDQRPSIRLSEQFADKGWKTKRTILISVKDAPPVPWPSNVNKRAKRAL